MPDYFYVPFPTAGHLGAYLGDSAIAGDTVHATRVGLKVLTSNLSIWDNDDWNSGDVGHFVDKHGPGVFGKLGRGKRVLSVVKAGEYVYVTGHGGGAANPTVIGGHFNKKREDKADLSAVRAIKAETLARRMSKEGLTKDIRGIGIIICESGIGGNAKAVTRDCFAQIFAREMGVLGYGSVEVAGYLGELAGAGPDIATVIVGDERYKLEERRRVFDSKGNEIA